VRPEAVIAAARIRRPLDKSLHRPEGNDAASGLTLLPHTFTNF
jgi:hypothetical protein